MEVNSKGGTPNTERPTLNSHCSAESQAINDQPFVLAA